MTPSHEWHVAEMGMGVAVATAQTVPAWWAAIPPELRAMTAIILMQILRAFVVFVFQLLRALAARAGLKLQNGKTEK